MRLSLGPAQASGRYLIPSKRGRIYGWSIYREGTHETVAYMTACDLDLVERRALAERMVFAFNEASAVSGDRTDADAKEVAR